MQKGITYYLRADPARPINVGRMSIVRRGLSPSAPDTLGPISEDDAITVGMSSAGDAYYISYFFEAVAGQNLVITVTQHRSNASWHLYGLTNEVIPPQVSVMVIR